MNEIQNMDQQQLPRRRRPSILKRVFSDSEIEISSQELSKNGDEQFTVQSRRVSFGSSYIKEFKSASFEDTEIERVPDRVGVGQGGEQKFKSLGNVDCNDMELGFPNFNETYIVGGGGGGRRGNIENIPYPDDVVTLPVVRRDKDVTFSVGGNKHKPMNVFFGNISNRNWSSVITSNSIPTKNMMNKTFVSSVDMDISRTDGNQVSVETALVDKCTTRELSLCRQDYQNATIRIPEKLDFSLSETIYSSTEICDSGFKSISSSFLNSKTFYGGDMSVCSELFYDRNVLRSTRPSAILSKGSFYSRSENLQNGQKTDVTFVTNCHPDSEHVLIGKSIGTWTLDADKCQSYSTSFVECLEDQVEPSLCQSDFGVSMNLQDEPVNLEDEIDEFDASALDDFHISPELERFIKHNSAIRGTERLRCWEETMEEIINMSPETYEKFSQIFRHCFHPQYLEAIQIHRRVKKRLDQLCMCNSQ